MQQYFYVKEQNVKIGEGIGYDFLGTRKVAIVNAIDHVHGYVSNNGFSGFSTSGYFINGVRAKALTPYAKKYGCKTVSEFKQKITKFYTKTRGYYEFDFYILTCELQATDELVNNA